MGRGTAQEDPGVFMGKKSHWLWENEPLTELNRSSDSREVRTPQQTRLQDKAVNDHGLVTGHKRSSSSGRR